MGEFALKTGDSAAARRDLQRAVDGGERNAATLGELADAMWKDGRRDEARATLTAALELEPKNATLLKLARTIR